MVDYFCFPLFFSNNIKSKHNKRIYEDYLNNNDYEGLSYFLFYLMINSLGSISNSLGKHVMIPEDSDIICPSRHTCLVMENALKSNKLIICDLCTGLFVDIYNSPISIQNCSIFAVIDSYMFRFMIEEIKKYGGTPIISKSDKEKTTNWFRYFPLNREMIYTSYGGLLSNLNKYLETLGKENKLFIKTVTKFISGVYSYDKYKKKFVSSNETEKSDIEDNKVLNPEDQKKLDINNLSKERKIIISSPLEIIKDEYDTREWRVFVINGVIQNISRQTYGNILPIEPYVIEYIKQQVQLANKTMPVSSYVIDFMEYMSEEGFPSLTVTEFNTIFDSDIYNNNTTFSVLNKKKK